MKIFLRIIGLGLLSSIGSLLWAQVQEITLPDEFNDQLVSDAWGRPTGFFFDQDAHVIIWTKAGRIYRSEDGTPPPAPFLDISEEVANFGDHGLLGVTLDPDFSVNGHIYLLYVVDRHHLFHFGTTDYDPTRNEYQAPTIGRVTRYTLDISGDTWQVVPGSRRILLGEDASTGLPLLHLSHGVGTVAFGRDRSLLVSIGDGASFVRPDSGGDSVEARATQALTEGIIQPYEDVGAFRSQLLDSYSGKILRMDPETGDGLPSNPFFDADAPRSPRSRTWAFGLRNPFRFLVMPETGSHDIAGGDPGIILASDVGGNKWEELNQITEGGQNLGWPLYEGIFTSPDFHPMDIEHKLTKNPLAGEAGCEADGFYFRDLITQPLEHATPALYNPCDRSRLLPLDAPQWVHTPPAITYNNALWHWWVEDTYVPAYDEAGKLIRKNTEDMDSPVASEYFNGICVIDGAFIDTDTWPAGYEGSLLLADFSGWIRRFQFDSITHELVSVKPFMESKVSDIENENVRIVQMNMHPTDHCLWYIDYGQPSELRRICFGGNPPPVARIRMDQQYGATPLTVSFSADSSRDPEGEPLTYEWDFGDGNSSREVAVEHTFYASSDAPESFLVKLRVTDSAGASHTALTQIAVNNTPPEVQITSFPDGALYTTTGNTQLPLRAEVTDAEHSGADLHYEWLPILYHNTHNHPENIDTARESSVLLEPLGCGDEAYWYEVRLRVTDAAGSEQTVSHFLYPYCGAPRNVFESLTAARLGTGVSVTWEMGLEVPGSEFDVQRSPDGWEFETVGTLASGSPSGYRFVDVWNGKEEMRYRIQARTAEQFREYSPAVDMQHDQVPEVRLFPSPAQDLLQFEFPLLEASTPYEIADMAGRIVKEGYIPGPRFPPIQSLSISDLPAGIYICRVYYGNRWIIRRFTKGE